MGFKERLRRLEREAERANTPTLAEYSVAAMRQTARRQRGPLDRLARLPPLDGSPLAHLGRGRELLADDTPELAENDRRVVEAWERAHGKADIRAAADAARAEVLRWGRGY